MRSSSPRRVVQIGTQHRSEPYQLAAREVLRSGALGEVSKYEIVWNYNGPRWRGRPEVKLVREADVDWKKWLMTKPYRPFDPQLYFEFRLYREFSSGIPDQWMSHGIDLVHFFMNDQPPRSVVAHGGVFAWHDGRENPDTFHALVEYPSMLASYSTSFGNDSDSFSRIMGKKATLVNIGGEGSPRWKLVEEKGNHEDNPTIARAERWVTLPGDDKPGPINIGDEDLSHLTNWFECLRSRNTKTNATVDNGFLHSVAIIMAAQSYWQGKRLYYDAGVGTDQGQRTSVLVRRGPWLTRASLNTALTAPARKMRLRRPTASETVLGLLCLMYLITYVDRVNIATAASEIRRELTLSNTQLAFVLSAFGYPYILFQVFGGWLGDRVGPRRTLFRLRGDLVRGHDSDRIRWQSHDAVSRPDPDRRRRRRHLSCRHPGDAGVDRTESARVRPGNHARVRSPGQRADAAARRVADCPDHVARFVRRARRVSLLWVGAWVWYFRDVPAEHHAITTAELERLPNLAVRRPTENAG